MPEQLDNNTSGTSGTLADQITPGSDPDNQTVAEKSGPKTVMVLLGGVADAPAQPDPNNELQPRLLQLYSRGLVRAASNHDALIFDGSTNLACRAALNKALRERNSRAILQTESDFNKLLDAAAKATEFVPIIVMLVGGSPDNADYLLHCVRQDWPILIIEGSGSLADDIKSHWQKLQEYKTQLDSQKQDQSKASDPLPPPPFIPDAALAEIVADGNLSFFSIKDTPENFEQQIKLTIKKKAEDPMLKLAWQRKDLYSSNALRYHSTFWLQQLTIIVLGVIIVFFATLETLYTNLPENTVFHTFFHLDIPIEVLKTPLHILLLGLPVGLAILMAGANRFNPGKKWIMLRAASEATKREIFYYRTQTGIYTPDKLAENGGNSRQIVFSRALETINKQWVDNSLDYGALRVKPVKIKPLADPAKPKRSWFPKSSRKEASIAEPKDTLYSDIDAKDYLNFRLNVQLKYYQNKVQKSERRLITLQWLIIFFSGIASFLTAIGWEVAITLSATIGTGLATYLEYNQVFNVLKQNNHAVNSLTNILEWWIALDKKQTDPKNFSKLIDYTESVVQSEQVGWVQQMQTALTDLREQQSKKGEDTAGSKNINSPSESSEGNKSANDTSQSTTQTDANASPTTDTSSNSQTNTDTENKDDENSATPTAVTPSNQNGDNPSSAKSIPQNILNNNGDGDGHTKADNNVKIAAGDMADVTQSLPVTTSTSGTRASGNGALN